MSLFSWLTTRNLRAGEASLINSFRESTSGQAEKEIFQSPTLLAEWVNRYFLKEFPLEKNYKLLPDVGHPKDLNMTHEQKERAIREIPVLRISGISLLVKEVYDDVFSMNFSSAVYPLLSHHLSGELIKNAQLTELASAVEKYVSCAEHRDTEETFRHYMQRVFYDDEKFFKAHVR